MSHYIAEIVLPPDVPIVKGVKDVMDYFKDEDNGHAEWWDFYIIGGRFSGNKIESSIDPKRLEAFKEHLVEIKVTVHALTAGNPSLYPTSQIKMVDALWREWFPGCGDACLLFSHARDQYRKDGYYSDDVCKVSEVHERLQCDRLIVARIFEDKLYPARMLVTSLYNGVEWQGTEFDGNVKRGLQAINDDKYRKNSMTPDFNVITVDYHN